MAMFDNGHTLLLNAAYDQLSISVLITDNERRIVHLNQSLKDRLEVASEEIKRKAPGFKLATLAGTRVDFFYEKFAKRGQDKQLTSVPEKETIDLGSQTYILRSKPIESNGKKIGTLIEWHDAQQKLEISENSAKLDALCRSQAVIEFNMDGTIVSANANFLNAMAYTLEEIRGKHHSIFVDRQTLESKD
nr:PAS domain-containing protein [uncultured Cohaesibacter sp.]